MDEQRRPLFANNPPNNENANSSEEEEWSEDDSSSGSYYSDSDSSVPEWESSIDDTTGELLFINCHPFVTQNNVDSPSNKPKDNVAAAEPFSKTQLRQSTRGKFLRLIRRRESKRHSRRCMKTQDLDTNSGAAAAVVNVSNKVKFRDSQEGEEREVILKINSFNENNVLGRQSSKKLGAPGSVSMAEMVLGINIGTLSDGNRLMIAGFLPESEAKHEKNIKIGDWLKSINNIDVTYQNIDTVIENITVDNKEVFLKLQRVAGVEVTKDPPINELNCRSKFVRELIGGDFSNNSSNQQDSLECSLCRHPVGVLYLNCARLTESNSTEFEDVVYGFPRPLQKNLLVQSRGIFITLDHLVQEITKTKPKISGFLHNEEVVVNVCYRSENSNLFLLMLPQKSASSKELPLVCQSLVRMLEFLHRTLDVCFENSQKNPQLRLELDNFFARFFVRMLNNGRWITTDAFLNVSAKNVDSIFENVSAKFEDILPAAQFLHLPGEAYMQIEDALTELEASDYREWNEEPLDCQRLFTILGSVLYHDGYLLASHLEHEDLIDVHIYCRLQGFLHLSKTEPLKTLVFWKEVFPYSCHRFQDARKIPEGKRYLLLVGSGKDLLACIMEAGGCTEPPDEHMGPDAFYVEEAQATLAHLQEMGLPELAQRWISMNPGPQITLPENNGASNHSSTNNTRKNRIGSEFLENFTTNRSSGAQNNPIRKPEVTSILKRSTSVDQAQPAANPTSFLPEDHYDRRSEDSGSQGGYSEMSSEDRRSSAGCDRISDAAPTANVAAGSRSSNNNHGDEDESDTEDYGDGSQMSNSSFDISELRQTLLSETEDMFPLPLTSGPENILFHFVQLDTTEGILLSPPQCRVVSHTLDIVLNNFRRCCHKIHALFQNTLRFKNMPAQDMAKSVMNKSLIAIKEHGVMFESPCIDDSDVKRHRIKYWVIGRLFYTPHPREVYVCYQDTIPQNMVELAFKINLSVST